MPEFKLQTIWFMLKTGDKGEIMSLGSNEIYEVGQERGEGEDLMLNSTAIEYFFQLNRHLILQIMVALWINFSLKANQTPNMPYIYIYIPSRMAGTQKLLSNSLHLKKYVKITLTYLNLWVVVISTSGRHMQLKLSDIFQSQRFVHKGQCCTPAKALIIMKLGLLEEDQFKGGDI